MNLTISHSPTGPKVIFRAPQSPTITVPTSYLQDKHAHANPHPKGQHQRSRMGNRSLKSPRILKKNTNPPEANQGHIIKSDKPLQSMTVPLLRHPSLPPRFNYILVRSLENRRAAVEQQGTPGTGRDQQDVPTALPGRHPDVIRVSTDQLRGREPRRPREAQRQGQRPPHRFRGPPRPAAWRTARRRSQ